MTAVADSEIAVHPIADATRRVYAGLHALQDKAELLQPPALEGQEWYELLRQKLIPQVGDHPWLVAAVVGGTNIGKSVTFNHLARTRASATSPLASGTRHPVCLVPAGFAQHHSLQTVFPDFTLHEWSDAAAALSESDEHALFWRTAPELPSTLLVLDTPDIDSDARVNWVRADAVRRSADVLIAVLTQQKYNDAAVKEFFRKAGAEDKAVLIVFNQCLLPDDEQYWPQWVNTFCSETGINPYAVYIAPNDRTAAEGLTLPFYERPWPVPDDWHQNHKSASNQSRDLCQELSSLKFREIRIQTLRGSLRQVLNAQSGIETHLQRLRRCSEELAATSEKLSSESVLKIRDWPSPPNALFVDEIRSWWKTRQQGWARKVNDFYDAVGTTVAWPFRMARNAIQGEPVSPFDKYRETEWTAILTMVEELFDKLQWMADSASPLIKPRLEEILRASTRSSLLEFLRQKHETADFPAELRATVENEMEAFSEDSPERFRAYRQLHNVSAAVRPMTSVVLFSLGMGPAGEAVAPLVANTATNLVVHVATDLAGGTVAAVAGDAAISGAAGTGAGLLQTWFHRLHTMFTQRRVQWLTALIRSELLGSLPDDMQAASALADSDEYRSVAEAVNELKSLIAQSDLIAAAPAEDTRDA